MVTGAPSLAEPLDPPRISLVQTGTAGDASWSAEVIGLPECTATGATAEEAVQRALAAAQGRTTRGGDDEQRSTDEARHSGRLLVRMPSSLHDDLAHAAKSEGVSLNQFITGVLASAVEWRSGARPTEGGESGSSRRELRVALAVNLAAVLLATAVAVTLLVAWRAGW